MFTDIQKNLQQPTDSGTIPAFGAPHNQTPAQYSTSHPTTEALPNTLASSSQAKDPPELLPLKQNAPSSPSDDDQLSKEISLYLRALKAKEKAWGPDNITTLDTVNDIGKLYARQGNFLEAEEMYVRALSGFEKALGTNHDRTLKVSFDLQELHSLVAPHG